MTIPVEFACEKGTFSVASADDADPYTVDIMANDGRMACTCRDWQCRCSPRTREKGPLKPFSSPLRGYCKHINDTLIFLGRELWQRLFGEYEPIGRIEMDRIYLMFGQKVAANMNGKERTDIFEDKL